MKKVMTFALCIAAVGAISAQKANVDQAKKMAGKIDKLAEARTMIKQAINNPETANDAGTYAVAGKIEFDAFNEGKKKLMINQNDPSVDKVEMGRELINGFNYYMKGMPLDQLPNEKGQIKPKYTKDMASTLNSLHGDFFNYGGELYNNKHYYPDAYNAFMIYGDLPDYDWASKDVKAVPDTTRALAYYYAGISAYSGNNLNDAVAALKKARQHGVTDLQSYVYEIACWQNMAREDTTLVDQSKVAIQEIAKQGYDNFGIKQPLFLNSLINTLGEDEKYDEAITLINSQLSKTPSEPVLYALRAWIYDRKGDDENALNDYVKGASFPNADSETLNRAARKLYNHGTELWNKIEGDPAAKQEVKTKYWQKAKEFLNRALETDPGNPDSERIMESIDYVLDPSFR